MILSLCLQTTNSQALLLKSEQGHSQPHVQTPAQHTADANTQAHAAARKFYSKKSETHNWWHFNAGRQENPKCFLGSSVIVQAVHC